MMEIIAVIVAASAACGLAMWLGAPLIAYKKTLIALVSGLPLLSLSLYLFLGAPFVADQPLTPRLVGSLEGLSAEAIVARLQQNVRTNSDNIDAWRLLARVRQDLGAFDKAASAWRRVLALSSTPAQKAEAYNGLAQADIASSEGIVSDHAISLLDAALQENPQNVTARFWRGMAWHQQGGVEKARDIWAALAQTLPDNTPLARMLGQLLGAQAR